MDSMGTMLLLTVEEIFQAINNLFYAHCVCHGFRLTRKTVVYFFQTPKGRSYE